MSPAWDLGVRNNLTATAKSSLQHTSTKKTELPTRTTSPTVLHTTALSSTSILAGTEPTAAPNTAPSNGGASQLTIGLAVGIAFLLLAVLSAALLFFCRRGSRRPEAEVNHHPPARYSPREYIQRPLFVPYRPSSSSRRSAAARHSRTRQSSSLAPLWTVYENSSGERSVDHHDPMGELEPEHTDWRLSLTSAAPRVPVQSGDVRNLTQPARAYSL